MSTCAVPPQTDHATQSASCILGCYYYLVGYLLPGKKYALSEGPQPDQVPKNLLARLCLRMCAPYLVVANLDRPTPPPEGTPSIPQAPVQPGPNQSLQVQVRCGCSCSCRCTSLAPAHTHAHAHQQSFIQTLLRTASFCLSLLPSSRLSF